jgi:hypothetical protein
VRGAESLETRRRWETKKESIGVEELRTFVRKNAPQDYRLRVGRLVRGYAIGKVAHLRRRPQQKLDGGDEVGVAVDVAVGHPRGVVGKAGVAVFVEENEAAGAFATAGEELHGGLRGA